jgi:hypothetical protein
MPSDSTTGARVTVANPVHPVRAGEAGGERLPGHHRGTAPFPASTPNSRLAVDVADADAGGRERRTPRLPLENSANGRQTMQQLLVWIRAFGQVNAGL